MFAGKSIVNDSYEVDFTEDRIADGIMIYFDKNHLLKSELQDQDGLLRVIELMMLTSDGDRSVIGNLFNSPVPPATLSQIGGSNSLHSLIPKLQSCI